MIITFEIFEETYKPQKNPFVQDSSYGGCMFETYGVELDFVKKQDIKNIWSILSCENEETWVVPGFSYVNRLGYLICEVPWTTEDESTLQVNDNEMCTMEEAINHCISFGEMQFNVGFDKDDVSQHFNENLDPAFEGEMSIGRAKYTAMDYYENKLEKDIDKFENELHNYYSQL